MKKLIYFTLCVLALSACRNSEEQTTANEKTAEVAAPVANKEIELPYAAEYNEQTQQIELKHDNPDDLTKTSPQDMINALNLKYPKIQLTLISVERGTVNVKIPDAAYLTENMGTTGAKTFLAEATYALTEISGITKVDFAFAEGDHASPGIYTRADFKDL